MTKYNKKKTLDMTTNSVLELSIKVSQKYEIWFSFERCAHAFLDARQKEMYSLI